MSNRIDSGALTAGIDETAMRWSSVLVKATWAVIVVGVIVGVILWVAVDGATGEDLGALTWSMTFAAAIAVMSIRQMLLAERQ